MHFYYRSVVIIIYRQWNIRNITSIKFQKHFWLFSKCDKDIINILHRFIIMLVYLLVILFSQIGHVLQTASPDICLYPMQEMIYFLLTWNVTVWWKMVWFNTVLNVFMCLILKTYSLLSLRLKMQKKTSLYKV